MKANLNLICLLVATLGLAIGCDSESKLVPQVIELAPPSNVVIKDVDLLIVAAPPGMMVTKRMRLQSRFRGALTNLTASSSCGCTSAEVERHTFGPEEFRILKCVFEGDIIAKTRNVGVRLFSPDVPSQSFMINMQFKTDFNQSHMQISAAPNEIVINRLWQENHIQQCNFGLTFGASVPREAIEVTTSSELIKAEIQDNALRLNLGSLPVGAIAEHVDVSFCHRLDTYSLRIPIKGKIRPLIAVTPRAINFDKVERGKDMVGEVQIEALDNCLDKPNIEVTGDWKFQSIEKVTDRIWKLCVCLKDPAGDNIRYGQILIKGAWQGDAIKLLLTGDFTQVDI